MKNMILLAVLLTAAVLRAQTFSSTVNQWIPDDASSVYYDIGVGGLPDVIDGSFGLAQVCVNLTHTWNADMEARLLAPDGTVFMLFAGVGGDGDNFESCCLRADASDFIYNFPAPFSGVFRPMGLMGTVNNGQNPNGVWRLILNDTYAFADQGFLIDWSLAFESNAPTPFPFVSSALPIAKITTGGKAILSEPKTEALLQLIDHGNGQPNVYTDTDYAYEGKILVELQGFTGVFFPKKNYDFDLIDSTGTEIDTSLLGMPAENDWIFKSEYLDNTLLRNAVAYEFARRMGRYAPRIRFCELFLDGEYQGVFSLTEKVKRDKDRVDIARLSPADTSGVELTGGYIIEMNHNGAPGAWDSPYPPINAATCGLPVQFKHVYPRDEEIAPAQAAYIHAYVDTFEQSLHTPGFADPDNGYRRWIDESTFIDFMLVNEFTTNYDSYGRSTFMYKEKITDGGKLKIGPAWDYDRAYCCVDGWVWELTHPGWPFPDWWSIFHTDTAFLKQERCRWNELRQDAWATSEFMNYIDSLHTVVGEAALRNYQRWPELFVTDYNGNVAWLKDYLQARFDWMDERLTGENCLSATTAPDAVEVNLYPNPAHERVQIRVAEDVVVTVRDATGRLKHRLDMRSGQEHSLDISSWAPGVYTVELPGEHGRRIEKLIVQ